MSEITLNNGASFKLLPQRAVWWETKSTLIVSDVHIGKSGHFRKNGVALPGETNNENLWNLSGLLLDFKPQRLLILGDLFHSHYNREWDAFADMLANFEALETVLVKGNHDILPMERITDAGIHCVDELIEDGFHFTHEPLDEGALGYNLSGHIHPAVKLRGSGRQYLRLPCFWFSEHAGVLPAFGSFTGTHPIKPLKSDKVFVIAEDTVVPV
jgi:DNA ligase-associated metallophosphoesterase